MRWRCAGDCAGDALAVVLAIGRPGVLAICWLLAGVRWRYVGDHSGGALAIFFCAGDLFLALPFSTATLTLHKVGARTRLNNSHGGVFTTAPEPSFLTNSFYRFLPLRIAEISLPLRTPCHHAMTSAKVSQVRSRGV